MHLQYCGNTIWLASVWKSIWNPKRSWYRNKVVVKNPWSREQSKLNVLYAFRKKKVLFCLFGQLHLCYILFLWFAYRFSTKLLYLHSFQRNVVYVRYISLYCSYFSNLSAFWFIYVIFFSIHLLLDYSLLCHVLFFNSWALYRVRMVIIVMYMTRQLT